jgi:hypothetical protein
MTGGNVSVHRSRCIHVCDNPLVSDIYGQSRIEPCYNDLISLIMVKGGGAEMFWRGAYPGYVFRMDPDGELSEEDKNLLSNKISDYVHGLSRYLRLQGVEVETIRPQYSDPDKIVDVLLTSMAVSTGIPKRILEGSERGELASTTDTNRWKEQLIERRENHCTTDIVRPFNDLLIEVGILPDVRYSISWPPLVSPDQKEETETNRKRVEMLKTYFESLATMSGFPMRHFLELVYGDEDIAERVYSDIQDWEDGGEFETDEI